MTLKCETVYQVYSEGKGEVFVTKLGKGEILQTSQRSKNKGGKVFITKGGETVNSQDLAAGDKMFVKDHTGDAITLVTAS